jgi:hypothetical protein
MAGTKWKFHVRGTFVKDDTGEPVTACRAIIESGDRAEDSPFCLEAVGPGARAESDGSFYSYFLAKGTSSPILPPEKVSVFIRIAPGEWKPYIVNVYREQASRMSATEMLLPLAPVRIEENEVLYVA